MKNLKKVLALVLAMALSFTMFAGAVAFDDVVIGSDYSAAISMLSDLNVISGDGKGNYNPDGTITRAEACVLIANLMNGGKADTARFAKGSNFSDVAWGWWAESAIAYCVQNGITYGVGGGKFAPNREITDAEFVAMVTRAMGYDTASNPLSFPYGNYTAAVNNDILDNVPYVEGSDCTRGEAAQILYDCLFADYARYVATQNVVHKADDEAKAKMIEVVFGLEKIVDNKDKAVKFVITGESCEKEDKIFVQGSNNAVDCTADVTALIGYQVIFWTEKGEDEVKAVEIVKGQKTYAYNPTMDFEKDLDLDWDDNTAALKAQLTAKNGNEYSLIDWNDDGTIDYVNATERYYGVIEDVTSKKVIFEIGTDSYTLDLVDGETSLYDECTKCDTVKHDYVVELNAEEGDVVEITVADNYKSTLTITLNAIESETKELTKIEKSSGKTFFDGEAMEKASERYIDLGGKLTKSDIDTKYDIWTNANGYIIKIAETTSESDYVLVLGVENGEKKSIDSRSTKASVEVMYTDGQTAELDLAFDAKVVNGAYDLYNEIDYVFDMTPVTVNNAVVPVDAFIVGGVFAIEMDENGDVAELAAIGTKLDNEIATNDYFEYDAKYGELLYDTAADNKDNNTVKFTGSDFLYVVDKAYVEAATNGALTVDTDMVVVLAAEDMADIDRAESARATTGAYQGIAGIIAGLSAKDQANSADYADGALLVVEDLEDWLGTKTHFIGAITDISVNSKGVYTFEMNADEEYSTATSSSSERIGDIVTISATDAAIIDEIAEGDAEMDDYGYALYADITVRNDKIVKIVLLVEDIDASSAIQMAPKANADSDYRVVRTVIDRVASDEVRVLVDGVVGAADNKLVTIDEYMDTNKTYFDLTDDTIVWSVDEKAAVKAGVDLNDFIAYDEDADIAANGELEESVWNDNNKADVYFVADLFINVAKNDHDDVAMAFAFEATSDDAGIATVDDFTATVVKTAATEAKAAVAGQNQSVKLAFAETATKAAKFNVYFGGAALGTVDVKEADPAEATAAQVGALLDTVGTVSYSEDRKTVTFTADVKATSKTIVLGDAVLSGAATMGEAKVIGGFTTTVTGSNWVKGIAAEAAVPATVATTTVTVTTEGHKLVKVATDKPVTVNFVDGTAEITLSAGVLYSEADIAEMIADALVAIRTEKNWYVDTVAGVPVVRVNNVVTVKDTCNVDPGHELALTIAK